MINRIVKHSDNILNNNSDNVIVGYDYTPTPEFAVTGYSVGVTQVNVTESDSISFTNLSTNTTSWLWDFGSTATPSTSTDENPVGIVYSTSGVTETVTLTAYNSLGSGVKIRTDYINVTKIIGNTLYVDINALTNLGATTERTWTPPGGSELTKTFNNIDYTYNTTLKHKSLVYSDGVSSDIDLVVISKFNTQYTNGVNSDGVYPSECNVSSYASWYGDTPSMSLSGLSTSTTYKLTFFGSRDGWVATSRYTITGGTSEDGSYVDLDTNGNYLNTVSISNITPSNDGKIQFTIFWQNDQTFLNVLEIEEGG